MAALVGQHQITTFVSPVNGSAPIDANTVRGNDNTIKTAYDAHDNDGTIHIQSSTLAARPASAGDGIGGAKWLTSDGLRIYYDNGTTWSEVAYLPTAGGTVSGNVLITGTLGVTGVITASTGVVVTTGGLTVTAGASSFGAGVTITTGGLAVTGLATLNTGLAVAGGNFSFESGVSKTGGAGLYAGLLLKSTGDGASFEQLTVSYVGNATPSLRAFTLQTTETTVNNLGILKIQPFGGTVELASAGVATSVMGTLTVASTLTVTTGGLAVSAGTTAVQALTATTGVFAGAVSGVTTLNASGLATLGAGIALTGSLTFATAVSKIIPGATSISLRNTADSADNLLMLDSGIVSYRNNFYIGNTASMSGSASAAYGGSATTRILTLYDSTGGTNSAATLEIGSSQTNASDTIGRLEFTNTAINGLGTGDNRAASIFASRDGANNSAALTFSVLNAGSLLNALSITHTGATTITGSLSVTATASLTIAKSVSATVSCASGVSTTVGTLVSAGVYRVSAYIPGATGSGVGSLVVSSNAVSAWNATTAVITGNISAMSVDASGNIKVTQNSGSTVNVTTSTLRLD